MGNRRGVDTSVGAPDRLDHSHAVAEKAQSLVRSVPDPQAHSSLLPRCTTSDTTPGSDARECMPSTERGIRALGPPPELVLSLVTFHTGAEYEADERGLTIELAELSRPSQSLLNSLNLADGGQLITGERDQPSRFHPDTPRRPAEKTRLLSSVVNTVVVAPVRRPPPLVGPVSRQISSRRPVTTHRDGHTDALATSQPGSRVGSNDLLAARRRARAMRTLVVSG